MQTRPTLFRLSAALAVASTFSASVVPTGAWAQAAAGDPPARVGRLARLSGTVSFHAVGEQAWQTATLNYPVTTGDAFWTEPSASAQIEIGATHLAMDQQSELDVDGLDSLQLTSTLPQGAVYLRMRALDPGEKALVRTARASVTFATVGRYEVVAGDTERPTQITVVEGAAQITGDDGLALAVGPHQTATVTGADHFQGSVGPEVDDPFLAAQLAAERPAPVATWQPPPVVRQMTGVADLDTTGSWVEAPQYGHVWYPPVEAGWVPYRHGHWAYVAPWGWTWVDDASWGFAPYHYGRWVDVGDRWGWVPVAPEAPVDVYPVYAPALVDFVGIAAGVAVGVGIGLALSGGGRGNVGWVPLGFREPYLPPYGGSPGYLNRINSPNFNRTQNIGTLIDQRRSFVNNGSITHNTTTINNYYANAAGATIAPAAVMQRGQPVAAAARPVTAQQFAQIARPQARVPVQPAAFTPGLTPAVARQHNIPVAQIARPAAAPGPALAAHPAAIPVLRPAGGAGVHPGVAVVPQAGAAHPGPVVAPQAGAAHPVGGPAASPALAHPAPGPAIHPAGQPGIAGGRPALVAPRAAAAPGAPPLGSHAATPRVAGPQVAAPHVAAPQVAAPHVAGPQVAAPHVAAPQIAAPHVAAPAAAPRPAAVPHPVAPQAPRVQAAPRPAAPAAPRPAPAPHVAAPAPHPAPAREAPRPAPVHEAAPRPAPHKVCPAGHPAC